MWRLVSYKKKGHRVENIGYIGYGIGFATLYEKYKLYAIGKVFCITFMWLRLYWNAHFELVAIFLFHCPKTIALPFYLCVLIQINKPIINWSIVFIVIKQSKRWFTWWLLVKITQPKANFLQSWHLLITKSTDYSIRKSRSIYYL